MSTKTQVAALLAAGKTPAEASRELGVSESYISQLRQDDEFLRILASIQKSAAQVGAHSLHQKIDGHYDSLEYKAVSMMDANSDLILSQMLDKPASLLAYLRTLNGAKRRSVGEATAPRAAEQEYVAVVLPEFLTKAQVPKVVHNSQNEVIEVDSRPLVSLSSAGLRSQLAEHVAARSPSAAAIARLEVDAEVAAAKQLQPKTPDSKREEEQLDLFADSITTTVEAPVARPPMQVPKMKTNPVNLHSFAPQAKQVAPLDLSTL